LAAIAEAYDTGSLSKVRLPLTVPSNTQRISYLTANKPFIYFISSDFALTPANKIYNFN